MTTTRRWLPNGRSSIARVSSDNSRGAGCLSELSQEEEMWFLVFSKFILNYFVILYVISRHFFLSW